MPEIAQHQDYTKVRRGDDVAVFLRRPKRPSLGVWAVGKYHGLAEERWYPEPLCRYCLGGGVVRKAALSDVRLAPFDLRAPAPVLADGPNGALPGPSEVGHRSLWSMNGRFVYILPAATRREENA